MRNCCHAAIARNMLMSFFLVVAPCGTAIAQQSQYAAVAVCTPEGAVVSIMLAGMSPDTCTPFAPRMTVVDHRIDLIVDDRDPPNTPCGDQPTGWCIQGTTGVLPAGVYRVFTTVLPSPAVERTPVVVPLCPEPSPCVAAPLGSNSDGVNGRVHALTTWDPDGPGPRGEVLVVGGLLSEAGGVPARNVALWDGTSWSPLGSGIGNTFVTALTVFRGELIAAGTFGYASGTPLANIARWDGMRWRPLGAGVGQANSSEVYALTVFHDELIAVGRFGTAGGIPVKNIARWDGTEWHALGVGVGTGSDTIYSAVVFDDQLIVAGRLRAAGGAPVRNIARWDGVTWSRMDAGAESWTAAAALALHDGNLFVSVNECPASGCVGSVLEWDGTAWQTRGNGLPERPIGALTSFQGHLIAAAGWWTLGSWSCLLEPVVQWDGKQWSRIAFAEEAGFTLNVYRDELIIGGVLQNVDSVPTRGIARLACTFPTCAADFNSDGVVNSEDFFQFLTALLSEAPSADINHDSMVDSQDLFTFIAAFFSDC